MSLSVAITQRLGAFALDLAFDAPSGITALFGRSGAGKTSVVNAIAGLTRPDAGHIAIDDRVLFDATTRLCLPPARRRIGVVFQDSRLFPHLSVLGNLRFGARISGGIDRAEETRVTDLLGLAPLLTRRPGALSGGEKSRVALGRALLMRPQALLLDEPLAALDEPRKLEILPYLERLRDGAGLPILYVSHSVAEIARLADHIVVLEDGRLRHSGAAATLLGDPALVPLWGPREAGALLDALVESHAADGLSQLRISGGALCLPGVDAPVGARLRLRVLASDVILALERPRGISVRNILPVTVDQVQIGQGPGAAVSLTCGADRLLARITARAVAELGLKPGLACFAILKATAIPRGDIGGARG